MTVKRGIVSLCICSVALVNLHCGQDDRSIVVERSTLTIHVPDLDERSLGPLGANPWFLVLLGLAIGPGGSPMAM